MLSCLKLNSSVYILLPSPAVTSVIYRAISICRPDIRCFDSIDAHCKAPDYFLCHPLKTAGLEDEWAIRHPSTQFVRFYDDNENLGSFGEHSSASALALSNFAELQAEGYEYFPYCQIAFSKHSEPKRIDTVENPALVYVGANKPSRTAVLNSLQNYHNLPIDWQPERRMSNSAMLKLYSQSAASIVLRSPGQESCITSRYFESLLSGRYAFFGSNCGAPKELTFHSGNELARLFRLALANDDELWRVSINYLKQLQTSWQPATSRADSLTNVKSVKLNQLSAH